MFQLEKLAQNQTVLCYARNDHLEFNIPYELYGIPHVYEPDFLVRMSDGKTVILEIKGRSHEDTDAKHQAARRWISAVNNWGKLGRWDFLVCRDPQNLSQALAELVPIRSGRKLLDEAEQELERLRAQGWTQPDFAKALRQLIEEDTE